MHLVYLDESGNSGLNLNDAQQPIFYLCAMVVPEQRWQALEGDLQRELAERVPEWRALKDFEVHAIDLRTGTGHFANVSVANRIALRDAWMAVGARHQIRLLGRSIRKPLFSEWLNKEFGQGIRIHPHVAAFALLARSVDNYLRTLEGSPLGILISDDNKEIVPEVEKTIRLFRGLEGSLRLGQIVEKGFFIDSSKSLPLQLCDLYTLSLRKAAERHYGIGREKSIDDSGIEAATKLLYRDAQHDGEVLDWLRSLGQERKKEAARE